MGSLVTFVIPTIGRPSLHDAVYSVLDQYDQDFQIVIMGDTDQGFTYPNDDKMNLPEDNRIQAKRLDNPVGSAGLTRDAGIDMALENHSDWIAFLDDDDEVALTYVERLRLIAARQPQASIIVFQMWHPSTGRLPKLDGKDPIRYGNVGISFAIKRKPLVDFGELQFGREDLVRPGPEGNEDIRFLRTAREKYALSIYVDPTVQYKVRPND